MQDQITQLSHQLTPILKNSGVVFAGVFGSRAKKNANENSDYDFLVEFNPQKKYTLLNVVALKEDLERILHQSVDVVTPNGLDKYIKKEVLHTTITFYDSR